MSDPSNELAAQMQALNASDPCSSLEFTVDVKKDVKDNRSESILVNGVEFSVGIQRMKLNRMFIAFIFVKNVGKNQKFVQTTLQLAEMVLSKPENLILTTKFDACEAKTQQFLLVADQSNEEESGNAIIFELQDYLRTVPPNLAFGIQVRVTVSVHGIESPELPDDTVVVTVKNKEFRVSPQHLGMWSRYFKAYFMVDMKEKQEGRYPITDDNISPEDFAELLLVISPTSKPISKHNCSMLLMLANRFEMPDLTRRIESFLIDFNTNRFMEAKVFQAATETYNLKLVQSVLLHRWSDSKLLDTELIRNDVYEQLSEATKTFVQSRLPEAKKLLEQYKREKDWDAAYYDDCNYSSRDFDDFQRSVIKMILAILLALISPSGGVNVDCYDGYYGTDTFRVRTCMGTDSCYSYNYPEDWKWATIQKFCGFETSIACQDGNEGCVLNEKTNITECCCKGDLCNGGTGRKCYGGFFGPTVESGLIECNNPDEAFCITMVLPPSGYLSTEHSTESYKKCGNGLCSSEGCELTSSGNQCCCKGDYCNGEPGGQCYVGDGVHGSLGIPEYAPLDCYSESDHFCYTLDTTINGVHTKAKNCGLGKCTKEGCEDVDGGRKCCCKGNLCNDNRAAGGSSLVMVAIAAAAASWLRS